MIRRTSLAWVVFMCLIILAGCKGDTSVSDTGSIVTVRLPSEPDMLNPARSTSSYATQIESHILYPLAEYDPQTYSLVPLLIEEVVEPEAITSGQDSGGSVFHYRIRDEAMWDDGNPVTGHDYAFTVKTGLNTKLDVEQWRGFLTIIEDVQVDASDPKKFDVIIREPYFLAKEVTCNFNIYPEHVYDSAGYLKDFTVRQMTDPAAVDTLATKDPRVQQFADAFKQVKFAKEIVQGSGPYRLAEWQTGQRIVLERKLNWWGEKVNNKPSFMTANPQQIIYEIVPDENTALTMLKDGSVDVVSEISPTAFVALRKDSAFQDKLQFFTPALVQCYYIEMNGHNPVLRDVRVRRALAHLVDYDGIIQNVLQGMAQRTIGPFHPNVDYYHQEIQPVPFDVEEARKLLAEAGWQDSNGNGTLDKMLEGKKTECVLDITVSQRPEGQAIALLLKEKAAEAGVGVNIVTKDGAVLLQDKRNREFDLLPIRSRSEMTLVDPYQNWHSSSDAPGGFNTSGFRNTEADSLLSQIRTTQTAGERTRAYRRLQEILAQEQPVIFLYVPLERLVVSKRFEMMPSTRRPGFFENLFVRVDS